MPDKVFAGYPSASHLIDDFFDEAKAIMRTAVGWKTVELSSTGVRQKRRKALWPGIVSIAALLMVGAVIYVARNWPFTQANVTKELEQATSSKVQIGSFRRTYFPRPGCIAENVVFRRGSVPQKQQVMTVGRLTIEGNVSGLLTKHLALIRAEGAELSFPPIGTGEAWKPTDSDVVVDELIANGASLEVARHDPHLQHVKFDIHEFVAHHLATQDPMKFEVRLRNPTPPGEVNATGTFGPWNKKQVSATPVSGNYQFRGADLGKLAGIRGILASDGKFEGSLESIAVDGKTTTTDFGLKDSPNKIDLVSEFRADVDSTNGDVTLHQVQARLFRTIVMASGSVAEHQDADGKRTDLNLAVRDGRIQDLLLMFVSDPRSPLNGTVSLRAKTIVPPGEAPFLGRLQMEGDFGIQDAQFTKEKTQVDLEKLSTSARGAADQADDPAAVVSDLQGHVVVRDGVATFSGLAFRVPGAKARLNGTFDLITQKIDLRGMLYMEAKLPEATTGIKSFLLKAIDPFLKKNRHGGAKFPVSIDGTYQHPAYHADPV